MTTVRIAGERKKMVERIALEAGMKCGRILRVSDVVHFLIDRYSNLELIDELQKKYSQPQNAPVNKNKWEGFLWNYQKFLLQ